MITKLFNKDFFSPGGALTLPVSSVSVVPVDGGFHSRTHDSGWTIAGQVHEDYFTWVNDFEANHPVYGKVQGNFESEVSADSEEAFQHFWEHHEPDAWDYADI